MATAMLTQTSSTSSQFQRGGVASSSNRVRHAPTCLMFRVAPRRQVPFPGNYGPRQTYRARSGKCNPGWSTGGAYGPFMWGAGGTNPQAWAELLRMWGVQPDSEKEKWRDAFRDMKRGQVPWGSMNEVMEDLASASLFPVDVEDREDAYYFIADVPGLEKGDIKIRVNQDDRQLTVSGERRRPGSAEATADAASTSSSDKRRSRRERRFGKFERKFNLPEDADLDAVSARVEKGVLTLMVRKNEKATKNVRDVEID